MTVRSWMVRSWPTVDWVAPDEIDALPAFNHLGTEVRPDFGPGGQTMGDTVWATMLGDKGVVAVAWEWVEMRSGVVVISDPNALVTNARFLTDDGDEADELHTITLSNLIAYNTPWQKEVMSCLQKKNPEPLRRSALTPGDATIVAEGRSPQSWAARNPVAQPAGPS